MLATTLYSVGIQRRTRLSLPNCPIPGLLVSNHVAAERAPVNVPDISSNGRTAGEVFSAR